jgi:hypothetical protein
MLPSSVSRDPVPLEYWVPWPELGLGGVVILVDHSGDDAFSADRSQVGRVPDRLRLDVRGLLLPGLVRPVAVVWATYSPSTRARRRSPRTKIRSSNSRRSVPMTRSQVAFIRGVFGKVGMIRSPSDLNTSANAVVKTGSRS